MMDQALLVGGANPLKQAMCHSECTDGSHVSFSNNAHIQIRMFADLLSMGRVCITMARLPGAERDTATTIQLTL